MSVQVSAQVWNLHLDPTLKLILLKFADCANDRGENAWPSVERIAHECCISQSTARRALARLRALGLLVSTRQARQHRPTTYAVLPSRGVKLTPLDRPSRDLKSASRDLKSASRDLKSASRDLTAVRSDPSIDPSYDPSSSPRAQVRDARETAAPAPAKAGTITTTTVEDRDAALHRAIAALTRIGGYPGGTIRAGVAALLADGCPADLFERACGLAEEYEPRHPWPWVRATLLHWHEHRIGCECRRPGGEPYEEPDPEVAAFEARVIGSVDAATGKFRPLAVPS